MSRRPILISSLALFAACATTTPPTQPNGASQVVYLQHVRSADMVAVIADLSVPKGLELQSHDESNSVLVRGDNKLVNQAVKLLTHLDKPTR